MSERESVQQHWQNFGDIHRKQRDICNEMVRAEIGTIDLYELQRPKTHDFVTGVRGTLPYGAPYKLLPPDLFLDGENPALPTSVENAKRLAARYEERLRSPNPERTMGLLAVGLSEMEPYYMDHHIGRSFKRVPQELRVMLDKERWQYECLNERNKTLEQRLIYLMETEEKIVESKWNIYRRMGEKALRLPQYEMDMLSMHRTVNVQRHVQGSDLHRNLPMGNFEFFIHSRTAMEFRALYPAYEGDRKILTAESAFPAAFVDLPIGDYGMDFTNNVTRWTLHGIAQADCTLGGFASKMTREHDPLFNYYWGLGKDDYYDSLHDILISTYAIGKLSVAQAIMLLTAEHIEGYQTGNDLLRGLVEADLVAEFTRHIPLGLLSPTVLEGLFIEGLVQKGGKKGLKLNPDVLAVFKKHQKPFQARMAHVWQKLKDPAILAEITPNIPDFAGFICPAAYRNGAISMQAKNCLEWCDNNDRPYLPVNNV